MCAMPLISIMVSSASARSQQRPSLSSRELQDNKTADARCRRPHWPLWASVSPTPENRAGQTHRLQDLDSVAAGARLAAALGLTPASVADASTETRSMQWAGQISALWEQSCKRT